MPYLIETVNHNGYRCSCCGHESEGHEWEDDRDVALSRIPTDFPEETEWGGLLSIRVTDGSNQEEIGRGTITWSSGYGRYSGYDYTRWSGHIDGKPFDMIKGRGKEPITDKTWAECMEEVKKRGLEKMFRETKAEIENKIKRLQSHGMKLDWKLELKT
jgi:hypothetical protein